jgi:hypothetical protein
MITSVLLNNVAVSANSSTALQTVTLDTAIERYCIEMLVRQAAFPADQRVRPGTKLCWVTSSIDTATVTLDTVQKVKDTFLGHICEEEVELNPTKLSTYFEVCCKPKGTKLFLWVEVAEQAVDQLAVVLNQYLEAQPA